MQIRILSAADVRQALPMAAAIEGMKDAFAQLSAGTAHVPLRLRVAMPEASGLSLIMPAFMQGSGDLAVKVVSVFNENPARGLPLIAVNHLEGHAVSARLGAETSYPFLLLLVSGGHCQLLEVRGIGDMSRLGTTIDDAAGEALDGMGRLGRLVDAAQVDDGADADPAEGGAVLVSQVAEMGGAEHRAAAHGAAVGGAVAAEIAEILPALQRQDAFVRHLRRDGGGDLPRDRERRGEGEEEGE